MPELPEVETVVRDLRAAGIEGQRVLRARVRTADVIGAPHPRRFAACIAGCTITAIRRRGKYIVLALSSGDTLLVHLRMTGRLRFRSPGEPWAAHEHVSLVLHDGRELRYQDTRRFGRWHLLDDAAPVLERLGPEPLDAHFTAARFGALLACRTRQIKPLLLDQRVIAGLGNIYADEALWDAGLHPERPAASLGARDAQRLLRSIRKVLRRGLSGLGTTLGRGQTHFYSVAGRRGRNQGRLRVFRRTGRPCPRCGTPIARLKVAQRSTHICPRCQRPVQDRH